MTEEMRIGDSSDIKKVMDRAIKQKRAALKSAVSFLKNVYRDSGDDVANIIIAEADENYEMIVEYLTEVEDFIKLRKELLQ